MKATILIVFVFLVQFTSVNGQQSIKDADLSLAYQDMPEERVYVHQNTTLLFVGERLYFSFYCVNKETKDLSDFSKIGYIEMVGQDGKPIFKQKIRLDSGLGQSDFFLPTSVASGSYKLIAYTRWMKNFSEDEFYQTDVFVVNPYQTNPEVIREKKPVVQDSTISDSLNRVAEVLKKTKPVRSVQKTEAKPSKHISYDNGQGRYSKRSKVVLTLKDLNETRLEGDFSISIRKLDSIEHPDKIKAKQFFKNLRSNSTGTSQNDLEKIYLPELRGELLVGIVREKATGKPANKKRISLSIPGVDYVFDVANTNDDGFFYFNVNAIDYNDTAVFQVLEDDKDLYEISVEEHPALDYSKLSFAEFFIDEQLEAFIIGKSIQNQIENAYSDSRPEAIVSEAGSFPFYQNPDETYNLDDYTRFSTIEETMVEIINHVWIKKDKNGESFFQVRPNEGFPESGLGPLLIVDGIFVQKHEDFMEYNSKKVKSIGLSRNKFIMGPYTFQGVLKIETKTADYNQTYYKDYFKTASLFRPEPSKEYFLQQYSAENKSTTDRIPDLRTQLLWIPNLKLNGDETTLEFYTSDASGAYEICLEGLSSKGRPISDRAIITVD